MSDPDAAIDATRSVVVCIPTYRRPVQLARLLRALASQRGVAPFSIVVGNNDDRDLASHAELQVADLPSYRVVPVAQRGVSAVRNAIIASVLAERDGPRWIGCVDDDQIPSPDWLAALLRTAQHHDADLAGGPVTRSTSTQTFWSRGAADTSYLPRAEGLTGTLNEAGNLLIATRFLRSLGRPPFSLAFGRTGGEDYEFFLFARSRDARIAWAPDARIDEPLPQDRLTLASYVWRFYAIAAYQARADRLYLGTWHVVRTMLREAAKGPLLAARALAVRRDPRQAIAVLVQYAACVAGRAVGLVGVRAERYGRDEPRPGAVDPRPSPSIDRR